jgi:hypothetical protein
MRLLMQRRSEKKQFSIDEGISLFLSYYNCKEHSTTRRVPKELHALDPKKHSSEIAQVIERRKRRLPEVRIDDDFCVGQKVRAIA